MLVVGVVGWVWFAIGVVVVCGFLAVLGVPVVVGSIVVGWQVYVVGTVFGFE
jgi:hypothetical protein